MQTPVLAHGVRNPGWRAMFCGAAMRRMRSSASLRSATILLRPATRSTLRGPNATGAMRLPTMSSQWSVPSSVTALIPVTKRSDSRACRRISSLSGRGIEASNPSSSLHRPSRRSHSTIPVSRIVIESPNDTSSGISASTAARSLSNASCASFVTTASKPWRRSASAQRASRAVRSAVSFRSVFVVWFVCIVFCCVCRRVKLPFVLSAASASRPPDFPRPASPRECRARRRSLRR